MKLCAASLQREGRRLARPAHDTPAGAGEADQMLALPAAAHAPELRGQTGGEQQLQAERQRARAAARSAVALGRRRCGPPSQAARRAATAGGRAG